jgi:hypothetical protein
MAVRLNASTFFLVGATRSGTSLLGLMLRNHPKIAFPGEFEFAFDFESESNAFPPLAEFHAYLAMDRHFRHHGLQIDESLAAPDLVRSLLVQMKEGDDGDAPLVGVAVHRHFDRLQRLFPNARYLHLVRDPRDVARSWMEFGWAGNAWMAARTRRELERLWSDVARRIPPERVFHLRFEDLVQDPPGRLKEICEFLGVAYDDEMLGYHKRSTYDPVDPNQVAKWRTALTGNEQRLVEGVLADQLDANGYERCGLPPRHVGPLLEPLLRIDDRLRRLRVRLRVFGWRNWVSIKLAHAIGNERWYRRLELERQAIINANLK